MDKRILGIGVFCLVLGLVSEGSLLTRLVKRGLTKALTEQAQVAEGLDLRLAPLHLGQLMRGEVGELTFSADRLGFAEGPVFTDLNLKSKGLRFDPGALLWQGQLVIDELKETVLLLQLPEAELTTMVRRTHPEFEPTVYLEEERVELEGFLELFGQGRLPFSASAKLEKASDRSLRLAPLGLKVAGVPVWASLFNKYAQEIDWEFPLEIPWPVRLERFEVLPGVISMEWREVREEANE